jgi:hypothetical protein
VPRATVLRTELVLLAERERARDGDRRDRLAQEADYLVRARLDE